jgi:Fe-S cluster biosynthesis and repair protein YggX
MKMTKTMLINEIEKTNMVINFDRKYLMRKDKKYLEWLYNHCQRCVEYAKKNEIGA